MVKSEYIRVSWDSFKQVLDNKGLSPQEIPMSGSLRLLAVDGGFKIETFIHTDGDMVDEYAEYQANYQSGANKTLDQKDADGSELSRVKVTQTGWNYQVHTIEWETCKNQVKSYDEFMQDLGFGTLTFYQDHARQNAITENLEDLTDGAKVTVLDWVPTHDYEILGGYMKQTEQPANPIYFFATGIPDVPEPYKTNLDLFPKAFTTGGINLEFLANGDSIVLDGKASKLLPYTPGLNTNKMRLVMTHPIGLVHRVQLSFFIFVP